MHTLRDAYTARGLELRRKTATEWSGPCPLHGGEDCFTVFVRQDDGRGTWYCRKCDKGGDLIEYYRHFEGMDFRSACRAAGRKLPQTASTASPRAPGEHGRGLKQARKPDANSSPEARSAQVLDRVAWQSKATEFVAACAARLIPESPAGRWLSARGLPPESWQAYGLGYNPGENNKPHTMRVRKSWGLADGTPTMKGGKPRKALWLPRGIVIPHMAGQRATRLRIRRNNADLSGGVLPKMKYYVIPGSDMAPLVLPCRGGVLPPDACAVVVESELDAMAVHHAAGDLALCFAAMTAKLRHIPKEQLAALRRCAVILVALDYGDKDEAGAEGWRLWQETFPQARRWMVDRGKDPGEAFGLGLDLRAWVTAGLPPAMAALIYRREEIESSASSETGRNDEDVPASKATEAVLPHIMEQDSARINPSPEELAHARRMQVACPHTQEWLHCWYCAHCDRSSRCTAWHKNRSDVLFYRRSSLPSSAFVLEEQARTIPQECA